MHERAKLANSMERALFKAEMIKILRFRYENSGLYGSVYEDKLGISGYSQMSAKQREDYWCSLSYEKLTDKLLSELIRYLEGDSRRRVFYSLEELFRFYEVNFPDE